MCWEIPYNCDIPSWKPKVNISSLLYETLADADFLCEGAPVTAAVFRDPIIGSQCAIKAQASVCQLDDLSYGWSSPLCLKKLYLA